MNGKQLLLCLLILSCGFALKAQDSIALDKRRITEVTIDSNLRIAAVPYDTIIKKHSPRTAAIRSAMIPGWGQVYNGKAWKVPIVYGALGVTGYIFFDNLKTYKEYRFAYSARIKAMDLINPDSTDYNTLKDLYKIVQPESIKAARNRFRQYIDYSVLFFMLFWGLNVVDASVDAHLKSFDVSPDLSLNLKFKPGFSEMSNTLGVSLVLAFDNKKPLQTFRFK